MNDGYAAVNLGFNVIYNGKEYAQVSISSNGYVCLGENTLCGSATRPTSYYDILVGLNYDFDTKK